jgi:hypothetical protein
MDVVILSCIFFVSVIVLAYFGQLLENRGWRPTYVRLCGGITFAAIVWFCDWIMFSSSFAGILAN